MKQHPQNGWFHASEFLRAAIAIHQASTIEHHHWLIIGSRCKYLSLHVDQRTGDFIIRDSEGNIVDNDVLYEMFPELKD